MATTITTNAGVSTLKIEYVAPQAKMLDTAIKAAEQLWSEGYGPTDENNVQVPFASLNNAQKLSIIDSAVKAYLKSKAVTFDRRAADAASVATLLSNLGFDD